MHSVSLRFFWRIIFFTYDEKDPWNQMPSWLSELLLNMSKIENLQEGYERMCELALFSEPSLQADEADQRENSYSVISTRNV